VVARPIKMQTEQLLCWSGPTFFPLFPGENDAGFRKQASFGHFSRNSDLYAVFYTVAFFRGRGIFSSVFLTLSFLSSSAFVALFPHQTLGLSGLIKQRCSSRFYAHQQQVGLGPCSFYNELLNQRVRLNFYPSTGGEKKTVGHSDPVSFPSTELAGFRMVTACHHSARLCASSMRILHFIRYLTFP